jgi:DUF3015 family protein
MKKITSLAASSIFVLLFIAGPAFSKDMSVATKDSYGTAGCGLGSLLFGNQPGAVQIVAATTNGTFGTQTFGITTGTSNCGPGLVTSSQNDSLTRFVEKNMDNLAKDIARGNGESLNTLAEITGISEDQKSTVFANLQAHFSTIFPSEKVQVSEVVDQIVAIVKG